jgi:glycosyltransferase involved in cell wall biosynthesis
MLHRGDAVGRHTLRLHELLVARGIESRIYVELIDPETADETTLASTYPGRSQPGDVLIYQFATASDLAPWLAARGETLVVNYHNITPPELFAAWDNRLALHQVRARAELDLLSSRAALGIADSNFNRRDLEGAGYRATAVVPPLAGLPWGDGAIGVEGNPLLPVRKKPGSGARWLSVGRVAPNKVIEDVVMALLVARSAYDADAVLEIVGKPVIASYADALHRFVRDLGLDQAVTFTGYASDADLASAYARADVLVVASGHEGFCVPLVEAMSMGLPIVASRAGALPEIVGEAGVVIDTEDPWLVARTVTALLGDGARCLALAELGRTQLDALGLDTAGDRLIDLVCALR